MLINWVNQFKCQVKNNGLKYEENERYLKLCFNFSAESRHHFVQLAQSCPEGFFSKKTFSHDEGGETLEGLNLDQTSLSDGDSCSLLMIKSNTVSPFFLTPEGFKNGICNITKEDVVFIDDVIGFSSLSCQFVPVKDFESFFARKASPKDCEDSFATFINGRIEAYLDLSIQFFLLDGCKEPDSIFFNVWKNESCKKLSVLIGNKIEGEDGKAFVVAKSERSVKFDLDLLVDSKFFGMIQEFVKWLVLPKRDAKVRHIIFIGCLIRESGGENLLELFCASSSHALESAQLSYDSLLDKEARESLKVMIEIRKAVFDVASQISKDAHELSNRAAADVAAIVGLLIARMTLLAKSEFNSLVSCALLIAAICYVGYRIYSVLYVSRKFFDSTEVARCAWSKRIYCNLNSRDREELSEQPIDRAKIIFLSSMDAAGIAYSFLLFILMMLLFF